jgi:transcriptional regulator with XRE-family HTH domain
VSWRNTLARKNSTPKERVEMDCSKRIKSLRKEAKISQTELASLLGVSKQTVSNYETGMRKPGLGIVIKVANIFNVSVDYIIGRDDDYKVIHKNKINALRKSVNNLKVMMDEVF